MQEALNALAVLIILILVFIIFIPLPLPLLYVVGDVLRVFNPAPAGVISLAGGTERTSGGLTGRGSIGRLRRLISLFILVPFPLLVPRLVAFAGSRAVGGGRSVARSGGFLRGVRMVDEMGL